MKIAIMSDTHISKNIDTFNGFLDRYIVNYDLVIHCGDFNSLETVKLLNSRYNFLGVWGNNDQKTVREVLQEELIIEIEGYRIGIFHGHGEGRTTLERAYNKFSESEVDIVVFGHSHQGLVKTHKNVLMINPGSPTNKRRDPYFSFVSLSISKDSISPQIIYFK